MPMPQRDPAASDPAAQPQMTVGLGPKTSNISTAKATLKVISRPPSDGMFRLLNHLNKTFYRVPHYTSYTWQIFRWKTNLKALPWAT